MSEYRVNEAERENTIIQSVKVDRGVDGKPLMELIFDDREVSRPSDLEWEFHERGYTDHIGGGLSPLVRQEREAQGSREAVTFQERAKFYGEPALQGIVIAGIKPEAVIEALNALPAFDGKAVISPSMAEQIIEDQRPKQPVSPNAEADISRGGWQQAGRGLRGHTVG